MSGSLNKCIGGVRLGRFERGGRLQGIILHVWMVWVLSDVVVDAEKVMSWLWL